MRGDRGRSFRGGSRGRRSDDSSSFRHPENSTYTAVVRALRDLFPDQGPSLGMCTGKEHAVAHSRRSPPRQTTHSRSRKEGYHRSHSRRPGPRSHQNHSDSRQTSSRYGESSEVAYAGRHRDGYTQPPNPRYEATSAASSSGRYRQHYNSHFPPINSTRPSASTRAPPVPLLSVRPEPHPPPTRTADAPGAAPVSYTHLTLPTIYSV